MQAKGRLQCWNADGQRAWWQLPRGMCRQRGRLQPWNSKGCRPEGVVAAASNALTREGYVQAKEGLKHFMGLKPVNGRLECPNERGLCAGKGGF